MLFGHFRFRKYRCRIGREPTSACHPCGNSKETAQHIFEACSAFETGNVIGYNCEERPLAACRMKAIVGSECVVFFYKYVITQKEVMEWVRKIAIAGTVIMDCSPL